MIKTHHVCRLNSILFISVLQRETTPLYISEPKLNHQLEMPVQNLTTTKSKDSTYNNHSMLVLETNLSPSITQMFGYNDSIENAQSHAVVTGFDYGAVVEISLTHKTGEPNIFQILIQNSESFTRTVLVLYDNTTTGEAHIMQTPGGYLDIHLNYTHFFPAREKLFMTISGKSITTS